MANSIHVNDIGTQFIITFQNENGTMNIASQTGMSMIFTKPDSTQLVKNPSLYTDGSDGKAIYVAQSGDISLAGTWKLQGYLQISPSGWKTDISTFKVSRNL